MGQYPGTSQSQLEERVRSLEAENKELKAAFHRLLEHVEDLEDSLDGHLAKAEHERSAARTYSLEEVEKELGL